MKKVLVPITLHTTAEQMRHAVAEAIGMYLNEESVQIHLLSVQRPFSRHVSDLFAPGCLGAIRAEAAKEELAPARAAFRAAGVPHLTHVETGWTTATIARFAREIRADRIIIRQAAPKGYAGTVFVALAGQLRHFRGR